MGKQNIKVTIANTEYPLTVDAESEEKVRKAVDNLNKLIEKLLSDYDIDLVQALTMVLLKEECSLIEAKGRNDGELGKVMSDLETINDQLGEYLHSR